MEHRRRSVSSYLNVPASTLDDLCSRFLLNIPQTEKHDMVRLCFQIELAHWFYLDFYRQDQPSLPDCKVREFAKLVFDRYPFLLKPPDANAYEIIDKWREYKKSVPTYGAIIMDEGMEHVLLVQGFLVRSSWGFPKGKINRDETATDCAAREVLEETGFDIKPYLKPDEYIEMKIMERVTRLYYVVGVPSLTVFVPKTRGEIRSVEWFNLDDLPCHKKDQTPKKNLSLYPNNFFMVIPFVKSIRKWVHERKNQFIMAASKSKNNPSIKPRTLNKAADTIRSGSDSTRGFIRISKEDEMRQRQNFMKANHKELQNILNMKSQKDPMQYSSKKTTFGTPHYYATPPASHSYSASRGRGRIMLELLSEHWKNFKFDKATIEAAIDEFKPSNSYK